MKLTLTRKIISGFAPAIILICVLVTFTLHRLNRVNAITQDITRIDQVVNKAADEMVNVVLAQESYAQRYLILHSDEMLSLFSKRNEEFKQLLGSIEKLPRMHWPESLNLLKAQHAWYESYFDTTAEYQDDPETPVYMHADSLRRTAFDTQIETLNSIAGDCKKKQDEKILLTAHIARDTFKWLVAISIFGSILCIVIGGFIAASIRAAVFTLRAATGLVSMGRLTNLPTVAGNDELAELSAAFAEMAKRLALLEEAYMDCSPLTRLPGGLAIENTVKARINLKKGFAFCMMDLDNFKPFNDRYGYGRGNDVIKHTAKIIQECSSEFGTKDDFVGHIGGDDFALITSPEAYEGICNKVIERFDANIIDYYDEDDRARGHIVSKNRQGETLKFPLMTISIAALNSEKSYVESHIEVGEIIAELKKYAKSFQKSNMVTDRRGGKAYKHKGKKPVQA